MSGSRRRDHLKSQHGNSASLSQPVAGPTIHVATTAMACEFAVIMNAGSHDDTHSVSDALQVCADIEGWLSHYQPHSDLSHVNKDGYNSDIQLSPPFFNLLKQAVGLHQQTDGAFDMAAGSLVQLWKRCRDARTIPTSRQISETAAASGTEFIELDGPSSSVRLTSPTVQLDPGAIGKGYALDEACHWMKVLENTPKDYLLHAGHSSLMASGHHENMDGWPVGIGNPLLTEKRLGTILLKDSAMSTSGSNIQHFRHEGKRYGHILDPRTGLPVQGTLSVTVIAQSALLADVLSTAFYVLGAEQSLPLLDRFPETGAIFVPPPVRGSLVQPIVAGIDSGTIFWDDSQVAG